MYLLEQNHPTNPTMFVLLRASDLPRDDTDLGASKKISGLKLRPSPSVICRCFKGGKLGTLEYCGSVRQGSEPVR